MKPVIMGTLEEKLRSGEGEVELHYPRTLFILEYFIFLKETTN